MLISIKKLIDKYGLKIKGIIHIGGHYAEEYEVYKEIGISDIDMFWFEPHPETFKVLVQKSGNSNRFQVALGDYNGISEMFCETVNNGQSSSLLEPKDHLKEFPDIIFDKKTTVAVKKLDDFDEFFGNANMLNIDTQGFELQVLRGGKKVLNQIDYAYLEVNRTEVYKGCGLVHEIDAFLSEYGFRRVETQWAGEYSGWGDAFYLKIK